MALTEQVVAKTCSSDYLYLDSDKANPLKNDIVKQFEIVVTKMNELSAKTKKLCDSGYVKGDIKTALNSQQKKVAKQATYAANRKKELVNAYDTDVKEYAYNMLEARLAALEAKIASMSNE